MSTGTALLEFEDTIPFSTDLSSVEHGFPYEEELATEWDEDALLRVWLTNKFSLRGKDYVELTAASPRTLKRSFPNIARFGPEGDNYVVLLKKFLKIQTLALKDTDKEDSPIIEAWDIVEDWVEFYSKVPAHVAGHLYLNSKHSHRSFAWYVCSDSLNYKKTDSVAWLPSNRLENKVVHHKYWEAYHTPVDTFTKAFDRFTSAVLLRDLVDEDYVAGWVEQHDALVQRVLDF